MSNALPYTLDNLAGAAARCLIAPASAPLPAKLSDVFLQKDPYTPVSPWFDVGATAGPLQVGRNITVAGYTIEQSQTPLLEEPTEVQYTVQVPFAELRPEIVKLVNESPSSTAAAGTATDGSGVKTPFGNIFDLTHYRIAFVVRRVKKQGQVLEGVAGLARGRFLVYCGYDCTMQGENVQTSFGKGQLSQAAVTFRLYPDDTVTTEGEEHGFWFDEDAQTLT
jgi:hypothetical protein